MTRNKETFRAYNHTYNSGGPFLTKLARQIDSEEKRKKKYYFRIKDTLLLSSILLYTKKDTDKFDKYLIYRKGQTEQGNDMKN